MTQCVKRAVFVLAGGALVWWLWSRNRSPTGIGTNAGGRLLVGGEPFVNIPFGYDSSVIPPDSYPVLESVAAWLQARPAVSIEIRGHTDDRGSEEYNWNLGASRAQAVWGFLTQQGVEGGRLFPASRGEAEPIADNMTEEGRARNRRVEFVVL